MKIKRILVVGVPGSGKSTLISFMLKKLSEMGVSTKVIDDYLLLRSICPKDQGGNKYYYKEGALVINSNYSEEIFKDLYRRLSNYWLNVSDNEVTIFEITNPNLKNFFDNYVISGVDAGLIFLDCDISVAKRRNISRGNDHIIPSTYMDMFGENHVDFYSDLKAFFEESTLINNTEEGLVDLKRQAENLIKRWFDDSFVVKTDRN